MEKIHLAIPQIDSTKLGEFDLRSSEGNDLAHGFEYGVTNSIDYTLLVEKLRTLLVEKYNLEASNASNWPDSLNYLQKCIKSFYTTFSIYKANTSFSLLEYSFETPESKQENIRLFRLKKEFQEELTKYGHYIKSNKETAIKLFERISAQVAKIAFDKVLVELTPTNSFKIKLSIGESLLVITKPFHELEDLQENEVLFSIFENKRCLFNNAVDIFELVKGLNESLDKR